MGRPRLFDRPMTGAERVRRHREKKRMVWRAGELQPRVPVYRVPSGGLPRRRSIADLPPVELASLLIS
jgi:hypothetical protein